MAAAEQSTFQKKANKVAETMKDKEEKEEECRGRPGRPRSRL